MIYSVCTPIGRLLLKENCLSNNEDVCIVTAVWLDENTAKQIADSINNGELANGEIHPISDQWTIAYIDHNPATIIWKNGMADFPAKAAFPGEFISGETVESAFAKQKQG